MKKLLNIFIRNYDYNITNINSFENVTILRSRLKF